MGTKRPVGTGEVLSWLSGSDITDSSTAVLPYWPQVLWAVLSGLRKLTIGCLTQTASDELPTTLEQAGSSVQTRTAKTAGRMITRDVLMLTRGAGAGEGNRTLV
jgi:hypothetical protein